MHRSLSERGGWLHAPNPTLPATEQWVGELTTGCFEKRRSSPQTHTKRSSGYKRHITAEAAAG